MSGFQRTTRASILLLAFVTAGTCVARAADADQGSAIYKKVCVGCHSQEAGVTKLGPDLANMIGRKSGAAGGTAALQGANITWTEAELVRFLKDPVATVPGTTMVVKLDEASAQDVAAYLKGSSGR